MKSSINKIENIGHCRLLVAETILAIANKEININQAQAIFEGVQTMNQTIQAEINYTKLQIAMKKEGMRYVEAVSMGQLQIGN